MTHETTDAAPGGETMTPEQSMLMTDNGFPRRNRTDLWTEAEAAIQRAVDVCERTIPADPLETDAIILLGDPEPPTKELHSEHRPDQQPSR